MNRKIAIATTCLLAALAWASPSLAAEDQHGTKGVEHQEEKHEDGDHEDERGEEHGEEHDEHEGEGRVHLDAHELKELGIVVRTAGAGKLGLVLKVPGKVAMPTDRLAHVVPRVRGYVREVRVGLGDRVKEGQVMAVLESPELGEAKVAFLSAAQETQLARTDLERAQAVHDNVQKILELLDRSPSLEGLESLDGSQAGEYRSRLVSAYSEQTFAQQTYQREKTLFDKQISSQEEFLAAENALQKSRAEYASARDQVGFEVRKALLEARHAADVARLGLRSAERKLHVFGLDEPAVQRLAEDQEPEDRLAWYELKAPFAGQVIEHHVTRGELLTDETDAYVVADLATVWVDLSVYPKDVGQVRAGLRAIVSTGDGLAAEGKITYVSPAVDSETRAGLARVSLPNPRGAWKPGMFVNGEVVVDEADVAVLVPRTALLNVDGRTVVFVQEGDGFEARPVTVGRGNELRAEITAGLQAGEAYATEGGFGLKAHLAKGSFGDGHNH
ncbi:MAG: efflux RND transporter periplasmic adaptor subunit [Thermodesulfobacteriota bacterium]